MVQTRANESSRLIPETGSGYILTGSVRVAGYTQVAALDKTLQSDCGERGSTYRWGLEIKIGVSEVNKGSG